MNRTFLHRTVSLTLALLIFISSVGFSADLHYCKGELKSFNLFGEASSCHTSKKSCPHHKNMVVDQTIEKDCCKNQKVEVDELDTDFTMVADVVLTDLEFKFITAFVDSFCVPNIPRVVKSTFLEKKELLPSRDIYVLLGRYLL